MSKRKREKMKSKEKRHEKAKPSEAVRTVHSIERKAVKSEGDLVPNLKDASPDWQQFIKAMSKAMK